MLHPLLYLLFLRFLLLSAQLLFLLELLLQFMQFLLFFLHSSLFSLPLHVPPIALLPLCLYYQSCFLYKWVFFEFATLFHLRTFENIPLAFFAHWYVYLCCSAIGVLLDATSRCFYNHSTMIPTGSLGL